MNRKDIIDPFGLLAEASSEEMQEFIKTGYDTTNPYLLQGWLVNYRKNKLIEKLNEELDTH